MGHNLLHFKQFDDAIPALQKGRNDSSHKVEALVWLGVAFWQKKNYALADKNLAEAQSNILVGNEKMKKDILYYRGRVAEEAGDKAAAKNFYNDVAAIDYGYKDVAKRLDQLNQEPN